MFLVGIITREALKIKLIKSMPHEQFNCFFVVIDGKNLVYSAPTGAGKSLIAEIILLKKFLKTKKKVLYILPFISLARYVSYLNNFETFFIARSETYYQQVQCIF